MFKETLISSLFNRRHPEGENTTGLERGMYTLQLMKNGEIVVLRRVNNQ